MKKMVGRRMQALRESRGFSRESVAQNARIDTTSLYRVEKGQQWIAPDTLARVASALGVSPAVFFTDEAVRIQPTVEEAWEIVGAFLKEVRKARIPNYLTELPPQILKSPAFVQLIGRIAREPGILDDLLAIITPGRTNQPKRRSGV